MKHVKKLLAVVLSAALAMAMCVSAFADDMPTAKIKVNDENGNTYSVYKVMDVVDPAAPSYAVTEAFATFFENSPDYALDGNHQITSKDGTILFGDVEATGRESDSRWTNTNKSETAKLATALANYARENGIAPVTTLSNGAEETLPAAFYLVVETASGSSKKTEVASKPILVDLLKGDAEITPKNDFVDLDKVIVEGEEEAEANSAQIGDDIDYKVTTCTPQYQANVNEKALKFQLTDTFSDGLTYNGDMEVMAGETTLTKDTDYVVFTQGQTVTIAFSRQWLKANQGTTVTLTYSAKLNGNAVVNDTAGNPNTIKLNYSNNPGQINDSDVAEKPDLPGGPDEDNNIPSKELEDSVKTYTYGIDVIKVDGKDNHELPAAEFTLADKDGNLIEFVKTTDGGNDVYRVATPEEIADASIETTTTVTSKDGGTKAIITGLDADSYTLTETKAPDEYTKLESPITVTIEEKEGTIEKTVIEKTYDEDGNLTGTNEKTEEVTGPTGEAKITVQGTAVVDEDGNTTGEVEADENGHIEMKVIVPNEKGISMPETGSRTAMYCMIGGAVIVVLGAGYYLMGARRNKKEQ